MIYKEHQKEFEVFLKNPVQGLVYVMGFLNDIKDMYKANPQNNEILPHLEDASEMLNSITKKISQDKGYAIKGNVIVIPAQSLEKILPNELLGE